jgi:RNA polymerase sigma-70 factor, ECF subfamily
LAIGFNRKKIDFLTFTYMKDRSMSAALQPATKGPEVPNLTREGEQKSFAELFTEYAPFIWRVLWHLGVREADLPDLAQEVFVVVHRKLNSFNAHSTFRSWIYGICIRTASVYRRRAHIRREIITDEIEEMRVPARQIADLENRRALEYLDSLLSELSPEKREVYILYEIEELTMAEVAEAIDCPLSTAYSRLYAAREEIIQADKRGRIKGRSG